MIAAFFGEATDVLRANSARSLLTILGLIIGVSAVIAIQIVGTGMAGAVNGVLGALNDRTFIVFPTQRQADFTRAALKPDDLAQVREVPGVAEVTPGGGSRLLVRAGHERARFMVYAEGAQQFFLTPLARGRWFTPGEVADAAHVTILSAKVADRLFPPGTDPLGASVRAGDRRYVVIGVLDKPRTGIIPVNFGGDIAIPATTYVRDVLHGQPLFALKVTVADGVALADVQSSVLAKLKEIKRGRSAYQSFDRKSFTRVIDGIFAVITLVIGLVGAVSLVVAGIGIMNIMLVSVTERTREIGVRKAIGANRLQILAQFFIEAFVLCAIGCGIGLAIGLAIGWAVNRFALIALSGVVAPIPWLQSVAIAVGFATVVTLFFGTYPAWRAARLDPIEALRYE